MKHRKPMIDQHRMLRAEAIVGDLSGMSATMRMRMRRNTHCKPMMDQGRMLRTEGIVLESVKIGQYISDM